MTMTMTKMIMTHALIEGVDPPIPQHRRGGGGGGYGGGYGGGGRGGGRGPQYYGFSFGAKGKAKTAKNREGQGNFFGQRARFNRERIMDRDAEAGGQWGAENLSLGAKGSSRGKTSADGMLDTFVGSGSGKSNRAHDIGGEVGATFD